MARYDDHRITNITLLLFIHVAVYLCTEASTVNAHETSDHLTACQHLRQAESRRAKSLENSGASVQIPKCSTEGHFEPIQCSNEISATECWCVDEYGIEIVGTRRDTEESVNCSAPISNNCPASSCRMFCPSGFARDLQTGCHVCQCRDPCAGVICPGGLACQPQEVKCFTEPCPPIPTCKRARSLNDLCPAGQPLTITDSNKPFLCGIDPGKPNCPPPFRCLVQSGNDYGVCCPVSSDFQKPGECPNPMNVISTPSAGVLCGMPCTQDLECPQMEKCCETNGCDRHCQKPYNITSCHQARMLSQMLSVNEREGRGYIPNCTGPNGIFSEKQCSRNGLVCWCVNQQNGMKLKGSMGAATMVDCRKYAGKLLSGRSQGRSVDTSTKCDQNICASICEYGFKIDHNGCQTCECSDPCEGYLCTPGSHCEVAKDPQCESGSALCASEPICKPNLVYSNPCSVGTPLVDNETAQVIFCLQENRNSRKYQARSFFDVDTEISGRSLSDLITCPDDYECKKLYREPRSVCCPKIEEPKIADIAERQQSMCEYLRDFTDRMEGTEEGMTLAIPTPTCNSDGSYTPALCVKKTVMVPRADRRKLLEQRNIQQMKSLLRQKRENKPTECPLYKCTPCKFGYKFDEKGCRTCECEEAAESNTTENLKLVKITSKRENIREESRNDQPQELDIKSIIKYLKNNILGHPENSEANYMAEILSRKLLSQMVQERNAKVIEVSPFNSHQQLNMDSGGKSKPNKNRYFGKNDKPLMDGNRNEDLVEVEIEECWCVDGFGTEIPGSRGYNSTRQSCQKLRDSLECLDITCRMGCDYGFNLDPETKCPTCECRDPCDSITCPHGQECRSVEVSCEGEYCPPVPACLPKKPGQCPFLVPPPSSEDSSADMCEYNCRSDAHCDGTKRCCSNGCGTQCVEPQLKTACQHLQTIQLHQASELGVPAKQKYIAQCNQKDGNWMRIQCGPGHVCWCVNDAGNELSGTRTQNGQPNCDNPQLNCPVYRCLPCKNGYLVDSKGCGTCECRDPCTDITCPAREQCELVKVECVNEPCPKMPICIPKRDSTCSEGNPLKINSREVICGPQNDADVCPSTHTCQLDMNSRKGVCCGKTRDVCFESIDSSCLNQSSAEQSIRWRFSPKQNKCIRFTTGNGSCQNKNTFHSESACSAVCPVLSPCERLRLKNTLAAKRTGQSSAWFQPRCDPETGLWSPIQCLGKSTTFTTTTTETSLSSSSNQISRSFSLEEMETQSNASLGVCWCADKKGAPVKGTLTRGIEPMCNHRQARRRLISNFNNSNGIQDPMLEDLIQQLTYIADEDNLIEFDIVEPSPPEEYGQYYTTTTTTTTMESITEKITERIFETLNSVFDETKKESTKKLIVTTTRCESLKETASFPVACNQNGSFQPIQCNEAICWCVDSAGNQLTHTGTFAKGTSRCASNEVDLVSIELHLLNGQGKPIKNVYDLLKNELFQLLGNTPDNLRVHENLDGTIQLKFDLNDDNKIDIAFALEEMVKDNQLLLGNGHLKPDITISRFVHKNSNLPIPQSATFIPESTFQTIVFILTTTSAFLVSIFVIFIMLKRGKAQMKNYHTNKAIGMGDKFLDYSAPIFVLSANEHNNGNDEEKR